MNKIIDFSFLHKFSHIIINLFKSKFQKLRKTSPTWLSGLLRLIAEAWCWCFVTCPRCIRRLSHNLRNSVLRWYLMQNLNAFCAVSYKENFIRFQINIIRVHVNWEMHVLYLRYLPPPESCHGALPGRVFRLWHCFWGDPSTACTPPTRISPTESASRDPFDPA